MKKPEELDRILAELKDEYIKTLPQRIERLREVTQSCDWQGINMEYHKLKGTGKTYGFPQLSVIAEQLELLSSRRETQKLKMFLDAVELLERMNKAFQKQDGFDLSNDDVAQAIMKIRS